MLNKLEINKRDELQWWDIVILSIILFGLPIWNSTISFFSTSSSVLDQGTDFSTADNWFGIITTLIELLIAFIYLKCRKFDFYKWKYKITWKGSIYAVLIFIFMCIAMDLVKILNYGFYEVISSTEKSTILDVFYSIDFSLILFSLLNGFYEEIFFLGICTVVPKNQQKWVFIYSLVVRCSFHTYQGILSALSIGLVVGGIYYFLYTRRDKNLYPYMLSHTFADIFGASIVYLF